MMFRFAVFALAIVAFVQSEQVLKYNPVPSDSNGKGLSIQHLDVAKPADRADNKTPKSDPAVKPAFCNKLSCPSYAVLNKTDDYELRAYDPTKWVQTAVTGVEYNSASYQMFMRLFRYISGNNADGKKIDMTVPVIVRIIPGQGPACENNFTMGFYVADPVVPEPKDKTVEVVSLPSIKAYVKGFPGFASKTTYIDTALALGKKLKEMKKTFRDDFFYTAGYDAPFKLFNRHNEVWFVAE